MRERDMPAYRAVHAAIEAEARATARAMIKNRARAYALRPRELDAIIGGISKDTPRNLVAILSVIIGVTKIRHRHFGFGGEIPAINLRGALLYARCSRAKAHQIAVLAAAKDVTRLRWPKAEEIAP
jgi:hypothetical protein